MGLIDNKSTSAHVITQDYWRTTSVTHLYVTRSQYVKFYHFLRLWQIQYKKSIIQCKYVSLGHQYVNYIIFATKHLLTCDNHIDKGVTSLKYFMMIIL